MGRNTDKMPKGLRTHGEIDDEPNAQGKLESWALIEGNFRRYLGAFSDVAEAAEAIRNDAEQRKAIPTLQRIEMLRPRDLPHGMQRTIIVTDAPGVGSAQVLPLLNKAPAPPLQIRYEWKELECSLKKAHRMKMWLCDLESPPACAFCALDARLKESR